MSAENQDRTDVSEDGRIIIQNFETYGVKYGLGIQGTTGGTVTWSLAGI